MADFPVEERAGGIVFRQNGNSLEYLMVTSNSNRTRWIFPAGHVETGETAQIAASREVFEEAGVETRVISNLGNLHYYWNHDGVRFLVVTTLFLMEYQKTVSLNPEGRDVRFFAYDQLLTLNLWEESRNFIQKAHAILSNTQKSSFTNTLG